MRQKQEVTDIWARLFPKFSGSSTTLQGRVREMMVHSILNGLLPAGAKVPPSRALAAALAISRNTVSLALQALVDKGFLISSSRSGLVVNADILLGQANQVAPSADEQTSLNWSARLVSHLERQRNIVKPANWQDYDYPFVYGQFDASLMPLKDWRACAHQALFAPAVKKWAQNHIDRDYEPLVDQIQHRLLPARGIIAKRDEILVTAGAQMACYLLANVLLERQTVVGIEDPGYPDARNNFLIRSDHVRALPIDADGLIPSRAMGNCAYVFVTPSHQCPTTVTMSLQRRHEILELAKKRDIVLFEDDHESELNFSGRPLPALKSLDTDGRVLYLGSLSKTLAHGLRIGYIVAPAELIRELRALRRLILRHNPANNAHTASLFIAQGHHDAFIRKLNLTYRERRARLNEAFATFLPQFDITPSQGGSGAWVKGPDGLNAQALAAQCAARNVLIEPGDIFFKKSSVAHQSFFRLGYSAIQGSQIEAGVQALGCAYHAVLENQRSSSQALAPAI
ncbi:MAG: PLP-dependent aminotransferase family protein [Burkholderiales bacterium]|nr:MAG: PLP-dependent aminotransferase family protein [Betaproteobacteria bacterium]TAG24794.1 MAG: PLP-dependent aminotransferase family protein [Burkholderiales bacterium]